MLFPRLCMRHWHFLQTFARRTRRNGYLSEDRILQALSDEQNLQSEGNVFRTRSVVTLEHDSGEFEAGQHINTRQVVNYMRQEGNLLWTKGSTQENVVLISQASRSTRKVGGNLPPAKCKIHSTTFFRNVCNHFGRCRRAQSVACLAAVALSSAPNWRVVVQEDGWTLSPRASPRP